MQLFKTFVNGDSTQMPTLFSDKGEIAKALTVDCTADSEGVLKTKVTNNNDEYLTTVITAR